MGIAIKDLSKAKILNTSFDYNKIQISAYSKKWQYGGGGKALILKSNLTAETNKISSSNRSKISIQNSKIKGKKKIEGTTVIIN